MRLSATLLLVSLLTSIAASPASAVIINSATGTENTTTPTGDQGWSNVVSVNGCSGVYLGDGWFITAYHVGGGIAGGTRLTTTYNNGGVQTTSNADLVMYQGTPPTGLNALSIAGKNYTTSTSFTEIGYGRDRATGETYWDANGNELTGPSGASYAGYEWLGTKTKRWGTNKLFNTTTGLVNSGGTNGITACLATAFDDNGISNECQAASGDSGGGVFVYQNNTWKLAGIMLAVDSTVSETAIYGDKTYFADLSYYSNQIQTIMAVPEPSSLALLAVGGIFLLFRAAKKRSAA